MFSEDLSLFFDTTSGFAVAAVFTKAAGGTVNANVIFNAPSQSIEGYGIIVEADVPFLTVPTASIATIKAKDTVVVNSTTYKIGRIEQIEDGAISNVYLS